MLYFRNKEMFYAEKTGIKYARHPADAACFFRLLSSYII